MNVETLKKTQFELTEDIECQKVNNSMMNTKGQPPKISCFPQVNVVDSDGDRLQNLDSVHQNMYKRLSIRNNSPGKTQTDLNIYFEKRIHILSTIYPFFQRYQYELNDDDRPQDKELVYDIEKMNMKSYIKKIIFEPGTIQEEDFFPKLFISIYATVFASWFFIDIVIFKLIYSEQEITGVDENKRYFTSQLKGTEYKIEIKENMTTSPLFEAEQNLKLNSIFEALSKQQNLNPSSQQL